jgi:hypothetical protein
VAIALLGNLPKRTMAEPDAQRGPTVITLRGIGDHDPWNG